MDGEPSLSALCRNVPRPLIFRSCRQAKAERQPESLVELPPRPVAGCKESSPNTILLESTGTPKGWISFVGTYLHNRALQCNSKHLSVEKSVLVLFFGGGGEIRPIRGGDSFFQGSSIRRTQEPTLALHGRCALLPPEPSLPKRTYEFS